MTSPALAHRAGALVEAGLDRVGLGHLAHRVWQFVRYGTVSLVATATSMTVLGALVATATLTPGWANIVATGVGTVPSFELNRRWVWGRTGRRSVAAEIGPFCVLSFAGLALSTVLVSAAGHWATAAGLDALWRTATVETANVAAFGSLWVLQFVVLDRVLFARRGPGPCTDGSGAAGAGPLPAGAGPVAVPVPAPAAGAGADLLVPSAGAAPGRGSLEAPASVRTAAAAMTDGVPPAAAPSKAVHDPRPERVAGASPNLVVPGVCRGARPRHGVARPDVVTVAAADGSRAPSPPGRTPVAA